MRGEPLVGAALSAASLDCCLLLQLHSHQSCTRCQHAVAAGCCVHKLIPEHLYEHHKADQCKVCILIYKEVCSMQAVSCYGLPNTGSQRTGSCTVVCEHVCGRCTACTAKLLRCPLLLITSLLSQDEARSWECKAACAFVCPMLPVSNRHHACCRYVHIHAHTKQTWYCLALVDET